jgi:tetratricopeptide (TPR) repeat protein
LRFTTTPRPVAAASPNAGAGPALLMTLGCALFAVQGCAANRKAARADLSPPPAVENYVDGVRAHRTGNDAQAILALETATQKNPKLTMARILLGDLYKDRGDYSKAADQYLAVTELDPYGARNFYKLGVSYHLVQKLREAVVAYTRAVRLDPKDWESHMNRGLVYLAVGRKAEAVNNLSRATILNPGAGVAFGNLAIALDAQGRFPEAEAAYKRALELDAEDTASLGNLGKNLMRQGKPDQAVVVLRGLADLTGSASARKLYADALVMSKRHDDALALYRGILAEDAKYWPALNGVGSALIGKYENGLQVDDKTRVAAVNAWRRSLALKPQQPRVEEMLKKWQQ